MSNLSTFISRALPSEVGRPLYVLASTAAAGTVPTATGYVRPNDMVTRTVFPELYFKLTGLTTGISTIFPSTTPTRIAVVNPSGVSSTDRAIPNLQLYYQALPTTTAVPIGTVVSQYNSVFSGSDLYESENEDLINANQVQVLSQIEYPELRNQVGFIDSVWWRQPFGTFAHWRVAYGQGVFVTLRAFDLKYSSDGVTWTTSFDTPQSVDTTNEFLPGIVYGNGIFLAVSDNTPNIYSKANPAIAGIWNTVTDGVTGLAKADYLQYGTGRFGIYGYDRTDTSLNRSLFRTSTNGVAWATALTVNETNPATGNFIEQQWEQPRAWGPRWIQSGYLFSTGDPIRRTSTNGTVWSAAAATPESLSFYGRAYAYGNGLWMYFDSFSPSMAFTSTNFNTWTGVTEVSPALGGGQVNQLIYNDGLFFALGDRTWATSTNGVVWNTLPPPQVGNVDSQHAPAEFGDSERNQSSVVYANSKLVWTTITTSPNLRYSGLDRTTTLYNIDTEFILPQLSGDSNLFDQIFIKAK